MDSVHALAVDAIETGQTWQATGPAHRSVAVGVGADTVAAVGEVSERAAERARSAVVVISGEECASSIATGLSRRANGAAGSAVALIAIAVDANAVAATLPGSTDVATCAAVGRVAPDIRADVVAPGVESWIAR